MYKLKQRDAKPGTVIVPSIEQLIDLWFSATDVSNANSMFWPAPVSVILDAPKKLKYLHMGKNSLAVRIPEPQWLHDLLEASGPLATTSANLPGEPPVESADEAKLIFGKEVGLYVDGGIIANAKSSKIVKITGDGTVETLRA